ncbi:MAG: hypothetical protein R3C11_23310 [Planctomycetaceae bacterium]
MAVPLVSFSYSHGDEIKKGISEYLAQFKSRRPAFCPGCCSGPAQPGSTINHNDPKFLDMKLERLMTLVRDSNMNKARRSAVTLGGMGAAAAAPVLQELKQLIHHPDEKVRKAIRESVSKIEASIKAFHLPAFAERPISE